MEAGAGPDEGSSHHWKKVILIPTLAATLAGLGVSYLFAPKYTSQSEVLVEAPRISEAVIPQVYNEDLSQQMNEIAGRVASVAALRPRVEAMGLAKPGQNPDDVVSNIQQNMTITPAPDISQSTTSDKKQGESSSVAFYLSYNDSSADEARKICAELTSMLIEQDLKSRQEHEKGTADFLRQQMEADRQKLEDLDVKLAALKKQQREVSPSLAIDYENARKVYQDDLTKQNNLDMAKRAASAGLGAQMALLNPASEPDPPEFPNRLSFAFGGLIAGLLLGMVCALRLWYKSRAKGLAILGAQDQAT